MTDYELIAKYACMNTAEGARQFYKRLAETLTKSEMQDAFGVEAVEDLIKIFRYEDAAELYIKWVNEREVDNE